jgi:hypothetical protein
VQIRFPSTTAFPAAFGDIYGKEDQPMRTILMIGAILLAFLLGQVLAAPTAKYLLDSNPAEDVLIHLDEWFANNPIKEGELSRSDNVFSSPRSAAFIGSTKDSKGIGRHMHVRWMRLSISIKERESCISTAAGFR